MKKIFTGVMFFLMSAILYSANVISVSISKTKDYGGQSEVGYSLIVLSIITCIAGIVLLLMAERDEKYDAKETNEQKNSFFDSDLDR